MAEYRNCPWCNARIRCGAYGSIRRHVMRKAACRKAQAAWAVSPEGIAYAERLDRWNRSH